jgi:hypothetical protein
MLRRKAIVTAVILVGAAVAWYLFRPERAFIDRRASEAAPAGATILLQGRFEPRAHDGRGVAEVLALESGERILRFSGFETLDGPDLQVYLLGAPDVESRADLETAGYVSLGALTGNVGDQNYAIPREIDLSRYQAVSVWCRRFGVNFTTAPLSARAPAGS